jgi:hypothetical protein
MQSADAQHSKLGIDPFRKNHSENMLYGVGNVSSVARKMMVAQSGIS